MVAEQWQRMDLPGTVGRAASASSHIDSRRRSRQLLRNRKPVSMIAVLAELGIRSPAARRVPVAEQPHMRAHLTLGARAGGFQSGPARPRKGCSRRVDVTTSCARHDGTGSGGFRRRSSDQLPPTSGAARGGTTQFRHAPPARPHGARRERETRNPHLWQLECSSTRPTRRKRA